MERLKIVSINDTHSQEDKVNSWRTDKEWATEIQCCIRYNYPLYVIPHGEDWLRRYFINQTLDDKGHIIPGDYETETPELGKVRYSIWTELSDYYKCLW